MRSNKYFKLYNSLVYLLYMKSFEEILKDYKNYISKMAISYGVKDKEIIKDLIQEGTIGFFKAYQRWSPDRGVTLGAFAKTYIRGYQLMFLERCTKTIRLPWNVYFDIMKGNRVTEWDTISLDSFHEKEEIHLHEMIPSIELNEHTLDDIVLYKAFDEAGLEPIEKEMVARYFGLHPYKKGFIKHIIKDIGSTKNVFYGHVRRGIKKLKNNKEFINAIKDLN